ncbi:LANO_0H03818g1_1 [Lachancea nothofagi CBS 11611]|uniref:LANO_0H03818g1_1 n=1 Tax=Lachancea nothofagi CBS 11611 TaxID=1266666 RepID=A0A1G4KL32_9SACH|nr:LANO_0H03818g1_1 [Lachancea nothofagi CBS 11611]
MGDEVKLTKKQLKAQQFRKSKDTKEDEKSAKRTADDVKEANKDVTSGDEAPKKKRKTRRGKGGKGKKGNRFLIFVGNLPKGTTDVELKAHFKSSSPDEIRVRPDKNIAFLEFDADKDQKNIQSRMDVALLQHKTEMSGRKINVELTVGGGGNSEARLEKLKNKNLKMDDERRVRTTKMILDSKNKAAKEAPKNTEPVELANGIHPDRLKNMK